jgi:hypothetical protein
VRLRGGNSLRPKPEIRLARLTAWWIRAKNQAGLEKIQTDPLPEISKRRGFEKLAKPDFGV